MSDAPQPKDDLQFDRVATPATGGAPGATCASCGKAITDQYYEVNGKVLCDSCRRALETSWTSGSTAGRFAKALGLGLLAAAAGSGLYYAILALTGYEIGLIAIAVGFIVGLAVRKGSGGRGGWQFQALAMFLTYSSIVSSYVPLIVQQMQKEESALKGDSAAVKMFAGDDSVAVGALTDTATPLVFAADSAAITAEEDPPNLFVALIILVGMIYAIPFLAGVENILGLVIIGIGVYEAWKLNKRAELNVAGPFKVAAAT